jgi:hypothetical protein
MLCVAQKLETVASNRQAVAASLASSAQHVLTVRGLHPLAETVCLETVAIVWLISTFHVA